MGTLLSIEKKGESQTLLLNLYLQLQLPIASFDPILNPHVWDLFLVSTIVYIDVYRSHNLVLRQSLCSSLLYPIDNCFHIVSPLISLSGHFIVLTGVDRDRNLVYFSNPSAHHSVCVSPLQFLEDARKSYGTDEDIIFIYDKQTWTEVWCTRVYLMRLFFYHVHAMMPNKWSLLIKCCLFVARRKKWWDIVVHLRCVTITFMIIHLYLLLVIRYFLASLLLVTF